MAQWTADQIGFELANHDVVPEWTDSVAGLTALAQGTPTFEEGVLGGRNAIRFDASDGEDFLRLGLAENPVNGKTSFSVTVVFATASSDLQGTNGDWYEATGLVDASSLGFAKGWGLVINSQGQVGAGLGSGFGVPSTSIYSTAQDLNDSNVHIATFTQNNGEMSVYVDDLAPDTRNDANADERSRNVLTIGSLSSDGGGFTGDIGELRIFDDALAANEVASLHAEIRSFYANTAPEAVDDNYVTQEDSFFLNVPASEGVLANDIDVDGDALEAVVVTEPLHGTFALAADGSFIYDPLPDFFGEDSFTYSAVDFRPSVPATVTITVDQTYDPVVPVADTYKVRTGSSLSVAAGEGVLSNDINVDRSDLVAIIEEDVTAGTLELQSDGSFTFDPGEFSGTQRFTYRVDDGTQRSAPIEVSIVVNAAPDPVDDSFVTNEDTILEGNVASNDSDIDGDSFFAALATTPQNGEVVLGDDGVFSYSSNPHFHGTDSFTYSLTDGIDESATTAVVSIVINAINDLPHAQDDLVVAFINQPRDVAADDGVLANDFDIDGDALTARLVQPPTNGQIELNDDGSLMYSPNTDYVGSDSFTYSAHDGTDNSLPATVNIIVATLDQQVVINEIHYDPPDNTIPGEFIEIVNQGSSPTDISNWFFSDGITFVIPDATVVLPGQHLVIAQDPVTINAEYGVTSLGPWSGRLSSEGERVVLRNADGDVVDEVTYRQGFPWPIAAGGNGPSMELVNPSVDNDLGGSWRAGTSPTPGEINSAFAVNLPPQIRQVNHSPQQPRSTDPVQITAKVTDATGVASVELQYQIVAPGSYVPASLPVPVRDLRRNADTPREPNPEYFDPANWTSVAMLDDGNAADSQAADDIFSTELPAMGHRNLIRYRIRVTDAQGATQMVPYEDDDSRNFAYFIYDGTPEYNGHSVESLDSLPVYHLIARNEDINEVMAYSSRDQIPQGTNARFAYNWPATMVYNGQVYDNINFRLRGANGRYHLSAKRSMRFRFNDGSYMQWHDQDGNAYSEKLRTLTTGKMFDNRQTMTYALNEAVNMHIYQTLGLPALNTQYSHFRVIDAMEETDRWDGDFWGFNFMIETYDVRFLEQHGLEKGNLYKLINQTRDPIQQQRYQAPEAVVGGDDHNNIERNLTGRSSPEYINAHVNLEKYYIFHAVAEAIRHYDFWPDANKNMVYYFEPEYSDENQNFGKLWILPWDTDASWGPTWNSGHDVVYNSIFPAGGGGADNRANPELWTDYFNTVREVRDLLWQPDQLEPLVEQFADILRPMEAADRDRWTGGSREQGRYNGLSGPGLQSIDALVQDMLNFAFEGGNWPGGGVRNGGRAAFLDSLQASRGQGAELPATPTISYVGEEGFPTNGLRFRTSDFQDPQGDNTFGGVEWRIARITDVNAPAFDPNEKVKLEWTASWESGELPRFESEIQPPSVAVVSGHTYRARVRMKDETSHWSHWSAPVEFTATAATSTNLIDALRVSEVHYHPADPTQAEISAGFNAASDFEFIELQNISSERVDIAGAQFVKSDVDGDSQGVEFDFATGAFGSLEPGQRLVVVEDVEAFEFRYGNDLPVAGEWSGGLSNRSEQITLVGDGIVIQQFTYDDDWHAETDGSGPSLEIIDVLGAVAQWNSAAAWRASDQTGGSPGKESTDIPGDSNRDGVFNSTDLVLVFQSGKYEDGIDDNATFEEGDWNGDGDFDSADLVLAFSEGRYSFAAIAAAVDRFFGIRANGAEDG